MWINVSEQIVHNISKQKLVVILFTKYIINYYSLIVTGVATFKF